MKALKAVEEHIGRALHEEGPQETLEVLNSVVRVLQTLSIEKSLVDSCFFLVIVQLCDIAPIIDCILIGEPTSSSIIRWRYFGGHLLEC